MDLAAAATPVVEEDLVETLRGQLMAALSLLASLGFDMTDLTDYLWT